MKSRIFSIDLAKDVFEVAIADRSYRILERNAMDRLDRDDVRELARAAIGLYPELCPSISRALAATDGDAA